MHPPPRFALLGLVAAGALIVACLGSTGAQTGDPKNPGDAAKGTGDKDAPKKIPLDKFKMPPGGALVLVEEGKDLRGYFPRMVIYTPEKHQELMDRLALLEKQVKGERKTPYNCKMTATVEGDVVRLVAELTLQIEQPRGTVLVGFRGTQLSNADLGPRDSKGPLLPAQIDLAADGYVVQADKAGDYRLLLELKVPITSGTAGERGFELALPGAAVTTLNLELPEPVKEVRWNKINVERPPRDVPEQKQWQLAVGKVTQLQVTWKEPPGGAGNAPARTALGHVVVRVEDTQVLTTAELTLTDLRGKAKEWRLWLPPQAKVKLLAPDNLPHKFAVAGQYQHILTLNAPTAEPLKVQVTTAAPRPPGKGTDRVAVGPFSVQDALPQEGMIEVKLPAEARRGLRLTYHPGTSVKEREAPRDQPAIEVVAVFKYTDMPVPPKGASPAVIAKVLAAPLEIDLVPVQAKVETTVEHTLRLRQTEQGWQILATCKLVVRPLDAPVDVVDVQLPRLPAEGYPLMQEPSLGGFPAGLSWGSWAAAAQVPIDGDWVVASSTTAVEVQPLDQKVHRRLRLKCAQPLAKEFSVVLTGAYTLPAGMHRVRLELPRPLATLDRGGKGKVDVPESLELLTQDDGPELPAPERHQLTRTWFGTLVTWDLAWRPYRPDFAVQVVADVLLRPRFGHVQQQIAWEVPRPRGAGGKAPLLRLKLPAEARGLKVTGGGKLVAHEPKSQLAWVEVAGEGPGRTTVVVEYDFPLPLAAEAAAVPHPLPFELPLAWPEAATQADTRVRVWGSPGTAVGLAEPGLAALTWKDTGTEVVPGRDALPSLVLRSDAMAPPLKLVQTLPAAALAELIVDRALIQVTVDEDGTEHYRARFLLTRINTAAVDIRMPVALGSLAPQFLLDGKAVPWKPRDSAGLVARLEVEPELYGRPVVLEVTYQLPTGQPTPEGFWHTTLHPPVLEGPAILGRVRWQVTFAANVVAVAARDGATTEQQWSWREWLPAPEPAASTVELEQWLTGQEPSEAGGEASLVSGRATLEPLRVLRVPRPAWFLICSGGLLLAALALYALPVRPFGWMLLAGIAAMALAALVWWWPELLPGLAYGALPGAVVLALVTAAQWMVHQRYRRQLVFMPGFTRVKAGSSLLRPNSVQRPREASTIDAPAPPDKGHSGLTPGP
jgi:hypothetical protein